MRKQGSKVQVIHRSELFSRTSSAVMISGVKCLNIRESYQMFVPSMDRMLGKVATITLATTYHGVPVYAIEGSSDWWSEQMFAQNTRLRSLYARKGTMDD